MKPVQTVRMGADTQRLYRFDNGYRRATSMNFINEWEPYPAQWIRNLIAANKLPPGEVDGRDVRAIQPAELEGYTQVHLMAGIGGWPYALQLAGWPATEPVWTASLPCQPFSTAGHGRGTDDERHLWPTVAKLIAANRPPVIFGEQVASKAGRSWWDGVSADLEAMDYSCRAVDISAAGVGAPHIRQRIYWVAVDNARHMANTNSERFHREPVLVPEWGLQSSVSEIAGASATHSWHMADADRHRQYRSGWVEGSRGGHESTDRSTDGRDMADAGDNERGGRSSVRETPAMDEGTQGPYQDSSSGGPGSSRIRSFNESSDGSTSDSWMGNTDGQGLERGGDRVDGTRERAVEPSGMGPWGDTIWIECADGKARRIPNPETQPGLHPLADGLPGKLGRSRAKKLKGYGNAIVPQVAATFIEAVMETLQD